MTTEAIASGTELADWLKGGMLFTDAAMKLSGEEIRAGITKRTGRDQLAADEHAFLETWQDGVSWGYRREGSLRTASGAQVAIVAAVYLPQRCSDEVNYALQCEDIPLGLALGPMGVSREMLICRVIRNPRSMFSIESSGLLARADGLPVAIAREWVLRSFTHRA